MFFAAGKLLPDKLTWHFRVVSYIQHIPWILPIGMLVPGLRSKLARLENFAKEMVIERKKRGSTTKDLFHHLVSLSITSLRINLTLACRSMRTI